VDKLRKGGGKNGEHRRRKIKPEAVKNFPPFPPLSTGYSTTYPLLFNISRPTLEYSKRIKRFPVQNSG
jgi:hypothetical protein